MSDKFPEIKIRLMLHTLGISHSKNGDYIQPNKRYSPYPTSYRNYYQTSQDDLCDTLVEAGLVEFVKGNKDWQDFYFITEQGKQYLRKIGYKWHIQ